MPTDQIGLSARGLDLSPRFAVSTAIVGSPAAAAETVVAQITVPGNLTLVSGILLQGWVAYTVGTAGVSVDLRIRRTNVTGGIVVDTGALTGSQHGAGIISDDDINGFDPAGTAVSAYVLTMQVGSATGASAVSAVLLTALAV